MTGSIVGMDVGKSSAGVVALNWEAVKAIKYAKDLHNAVVLSRRWRNPDGLPETVFMEGLLDRWEAFKMELASRKCRVGFVGFEQYVLTRFGAAGKSTHLILGAGVLRAQITRESIPYVVAYPGSLKKLACEGVKLPKKRGKKLKDLVVENTFRRFGFRADNDDVADAFLIALLATFAWALATGNKADVERHLSKSQWTSVAGILARCRKDGLARLYLNEGVVPCSSQETRAGNKKRHRFEARKLHVGTKHLGVHVRCKECGLFKWARVPRTEKSFARYLMLVQTGETLKVKNA